MANYQRPGVYVEEITTFPPAVAAVETALPAFVGYTAIRRTPTGDELDENEVQRIGSLLEFEKLYGRGEEISVSSVTLDESGNFLTAEASRTFYLYDAVRLFYANGGGDCFIVSVGDTDPMPAAPDPADLIAGVEALETWDEPTILLFPDAAALPTDPTDVTTADPIHSVVQEALQQCADLGDRVAILDLPADDPLGEKFRNHTGTTGLRYGAAYTPWLRAALPKTIYADTFPAIFSRRGAGADLSLGAVLTDAPPSLLANVSAAADGSREKDEAEAELRRQSGIYAGIIRGLNALPLAVPPSGAVAGIYALTDRTRGVWKAPANVGISGVLGPVRSYTNAKLAALNVNATGGKSINAIRFFTGKGTLVYGARTLAGNDNEYRYVSVRRLMNMLEESIKKASEQFVFEPNDANTWVRVQGMIENFLTLLWRDGALQGAKAEHAFHVAIGLGRTMTAVDVVEGRMIVEVAVAPVRPAEFIVLRFMQHLPTS